MSQLHETYRKKEYLFFVYSTLVLQPVARLPQPPGVVVEWVGLLYSSRGGSLRRWNARFCLCCAIRLLTELFLCGLFNL
jgi:hypothetical protein